jgi:hypothetical protein
MVVCSNGNLQLVYGVINGVGSSAEHSHTLLFVLAGALLMTYSNWLPIPLNRLPMAVMEARDSLTCTSLCVMSYLHMNVVPSEFSHIFVCVISCCHEGHLHAMKASLHTTNSTWHNLSATSLHTADSM